MTERLIGKKVIVRGDRSGVFFGTLTEKEGKEVLLTNCRKLWRWYGAASISQLAAEGTVQPDDCMFTMTVDSVVVTDVIEINLCTPKAIASIEGVKVWKK